MMISFINFSSIKWISQKSFTVKNKSSNLLNLNIALLFFEIFTLIFNISVFSAIGFIQSWFYSWFVELYLLNGSDEKFSWNLFIFWTLAICVDDKEEKTLIGFWHEFILKKLKFFIEFVLFISFSFILFKLIFSFFFLLLILIFHKIYFV